MKKKLFSAVLLLALATAPIASHAGFFDFFRTTSYSNSAQVRSSVLAYKKGDKADIILQAQKILAEQKMYDGDLSGLIGPKTELSIKAWQKAHGLPVSGLLDAETITSILGRGGESVGGNRDGIQCAGSAPQIMVTSPNGGESYQIGGQIEVTWETCNIPASELVYITIGTSANGQGHTFLTTGGTGTPNDGSETFTLSDTLPAGQYYVSAFRPAPNYLRDFSDNSFTLEAPMVCTPQSEPWVRVLSPNGGETYADEQQVNVTWDTCNVPEGSPITIHLIYSNPTGDGSSSYNVLPGPTYTTNDDGMQNVTFNTTPDRYGQNFKVGVGAGYASDPNGNYWDDKSDSKFTIGEAVGGDDSLTQECNARVLYPHPGDTFTLEENATAAGNSIQVYGFILVSNDPADCVWGTAGSLVPNTNPNAGGGGLLSLVESDGQYNVPISITGNYNFANPSIGSRLYSQSMVFNPATYPAGEYHLQFTDADNQHPIIIPINIQY